MHLLIYIAIGGALGAMLRFTISSGIHRLAGTGFPYGTLTVNVLGSLAIGFLYVLMLERGAMNAEWRALMITGLLGALTTFSTFSLETLNLIESGELAKAGINVLLSVIVCLICTWAGVVVGRTI